ncbi:MAG: hypothetical protein KJ052_03825 [Candidatus Hydrogenedentes bacterium]|nr:hypothetical protein [Candidatus Hydrogenedentota bacterium]
MRILLAALSTCCLAASAQLAPAPILEKDPLSEGILEALAALAGQDHQQAAGYLVSLLQKDEPSLTQWQETLRDGFDPVWFTENLIDFWLYALQNSRGREGRTAAVSGFCASTALTEALAIVRDDYSASDLAAARRALAWLQFLATGLRDEYASSVSSALMRDFAGLNLSMAPRPGADPEYVRLAVEVCLTVALYGQPAPAGRAEVAQVLQLPVRERLFWERHGAFLFDNQALTNQHMASLDALISQIPPELHGIAAYLVPDALGLGMDQPRINSPGQLIYLPMIAMDVPTDPDVFLQGTGRPVAAEFTVQAAQAVTRAIQTTQFGRRPVLPSKLDAILLHARGERSRYLRPYVPPAAYLEDPLELLPSIAYLYFIDSMACWRQAIQLFAVKEEDPLDSLLLLIDLFSGGSGASMAYATDDAGQVISSPIAIGRTHLDWLQLPDPNRPGWPGDPFPVNAAFVTAVEIAGSHWVFELDNMGRPVRYIRR